MKLFYDWEPLFDRIMNIILALLVGVIVVAFVMLVITQIKAWG